jgi:hypothetical protein
MGIKYSYYCSSENAKKLILKLPMKTLNKYAYFTKMPLGVFMCMKGFSNAACIHMSEVFFKYAGAGNFCHLVSNRFRTSVYVVYNHQWL